MRAEEIRFSEVLSDVTGSGRPYNYRVMVLPWEGDHANVMEPLPNDKCLIGTEQGYVLLFSLPKNKVLGMFEVGRWVSSLAYSDKLIWSVGADRVVCAFNIRSHRPVARFQEATRTEQYPETGITFQKTQSPNFCVYNCGDLRFKVFSSRTRKPVKYFDVGEALAKTHEAFRTFKQVDRVVRGFCVSRRSSKLFLIVNRYHPHIVVFDYRSMAVLKFCPIFKKIDRQAQMAMNMRIFKTDNEEHLFFVNQLKDMRTNKVFTFGTVLELRTASGQPRPAEDYHLLPTQPISRRLG